MEYFVVSVEYQGDRRRTVEVPVSVERVVRGEPGLGEVDCTMMSAAELAERLAAEQFGGRLAEWFAWKVEPDRGGWV